MNHDTRLAVERHAIREGKRKLGETVILGEENRHLRNPKRIDGKIFYSRKIYLSRNEANGAADANRDRGYLARVLERKVWVHKAGHELGYDRVQGYVLYVHIGKTMGTVLIGNNDEPVSQEEQASYNVWINKQRTKPRGTKKSSPGGGRHECSKSPHDPTFSKEWSGVSYAPHAKGKHCPDCGEQLHAEAGSFYCPKCDNYKKPEEGY